MEISKNQDVELEITGVTHDGSGVGRYGGMAVFVPGTARGDVVNAHIVSLKKNYAYGKLNKIVSPSAERIDNDCPAFLKCGGCCFRHISYEEELRIKYDRVKETLRKIAKTDIVPEPIIGSEKINGYRNKAEFPVGVDAEGKLYAGFFAPRSHRIVEAADCLLQPPQFGDAVRAILKWAQIAGATAYDEVTGKGLLRHIYLRRADSTGEIMACAVINGRTIPRGELLVGMLRESVPEIKSIIYSINTEKTNVILGKKCVTLWGADRISDIFAGKKIEISPLSFYQVNKPQAEVLYETAADFLGRDAGDYLLDLYCGMGTIGMYMSDMAGHVCGVEQVPQAVDDARRNAALNGIKNMEFICADAGTAAEKLAGDGVKPDTITVDPPRKGLDETAKKALLTMAPERIAYVSCDPATLARDIFELTSNGEYRLMRVRPVDMFPRSAHVETIVLMSRIEEK